MSESATTGASARLRLAISSSSGTFFVAVGTGAEPAVVRQQGLKDPDFHGIDELAAAAMADAGAGFGAVAALGVDLGPGSYSSVRATVSYVNGLGYALGAGVLGVSSLHLMAAEAFGRGARRPLLCLHGAHADHAYAAFYGAGDDAAAVLRYGPAEGIVAEFGAAAAAAGNMSGGPALAGRGIEQTGVLRPDVRVLYRLMVAAQDDPAAWQAVVTPLNDASAVFHEPAPAG